MTETDATESTQQWPELSQLADAPIGSREHFIPIRKRTLMSLILEDDQLTPEQRDSLRAIGQRLDALIHLRFHWILDDLKDAYASFNPDQDTRHLTEIESDQREQNMKKFFDMFADLIRHANYIRLDREEIEELAGTASDWGVRLDVDFTIFERLEVYVRGDVVGQRTRRNWRKWFKECEYDVPTHQRLIVCFHLCPHERLDDTCDCESIYIKMFKNIPKLDIDMLLPGTRPKITLLDQSKIWFPTFSGIIVGFSRFAKAVSLIVSGTLWGFFGFIMLMGGTLGYGVKSFFGYLKTKDKYQLNLTRNLYFQNLDNNAGVIHRLLDEAESQEFREAILAYYLLWKLAPETGWTLDELDQVAERYLLEKTGVDIDFEADDAVDKLIRLRMASERDGRLTAHSLEESLAQLERGWHGEWNSRGGETATR